MGRASKKNLLSTCSPPTTATRRGGGRRRRPRGCPRRLPIHSSVFGLRSCCKKSHPIPSKSALQSGNGSLGSPFVPWAVPAVYHISLTNCKIHILTHSAPFTSSKVLLAKDSPLYGDTLIIKLHFQTPLSKKWQACLCWLRLSRQCKGRGFDPAAANVSVKSVSEVSLEQYPQTFTVPQRDSSGRGSQGLCTGEPAAGLRWGHGCSRWRRLVMFSSMRSQVGEQRCVICSCYSDWFRSVPETYVRQTKGEDVRASMRWTHSACHCASVCGRVFYVYTWLERLIAQLHRALPTLCGEENASRSPGRKDNGRCMEAKKKKDSTNHHC